MFKPSCISHRGALAAAAASAVLFLAGPVHAAPSRTYRVTIENLTPSRGPGASQVLSPALVVVHDRSFDLFTVGERANEAVIDVAEVEPLEFA